MKNEIEAICKAAKVNDIGEVSDGFHTFNGLYEQRRVLFAALVKAYKDKAWKSYKHEDGEYCFSGGWFIVGIDTPEGSYIGTCLIVLICREQSIGMDILKQMRR